MESQSGNPWVRGYKIALTYPSSETKFTRELFDRLAARLGSDHVFYPGAAEYCIRLNGSPFSASLKEIYERSDLVIAVVGDGFESHPWKEFELGTVINSRSSGARILLVDVGESKGHQQKWVRFASRMEGRSDQVESLANRIYEQVSGTARGT